MAIIEVNRKIFLEGETPTLIIAFVQVRPEGHRETRNEVGSLSLVERLVGFELGTFQLQRFNPLGHSPQMKRQVIFTTSSP